jgi:hypothetical protein
VAAVVVAVVVVVVVTVIIIITNHHTMKVYGEVDMCIDPHCLDFGISYR